MFDAALGGDRHRATFHQPAINVKLIVSFGCCLRRIIEVEGGHYRFPFLGDRGQDGEGNGTICRPGRNQEAEQEENRQPDDGNLQYQSLSLTDRLCFCWLVHLSRSYRSPDILAD